jgi:hypothetical protein
MLATVDGTESAAAVAYFKSPNKFIEFDRFMNNASEAEKQNLAAKWFKDVDPKAARKQLDTMRNNLKNEPGKQINMVLSALAIRSEMSVGDREAYEKFLKGKKPQPTGAGQSIINWETVLGTDTANPDTEHSFIVDGDFPDEIRENFNEFLNELPDEQRKSEAQQQFEQANARRKNVNLSPDEAAPDAENAREAAKKVVNEAMRAVGEFSDDARSHADAASEFASRKIKEALEKQGSRLGKIVTELQNKRTGGGVITPENVVSALGKIDPERAPGLFAELKGDVPGKQAAAEKYINDVAKVETANKYAEDPTGTVAKALPRDMFFDNEGKLNSDSPINQLSADDNPRTENGGKVPVEVVDAAKKAKRCIDSLATIEKDPDSTKAANAKKLRENIARHYKLQEQSGSLHVTSVDGVFADADADVLKKVFDKEGNLTVPPPTADELNDLNESLGFTAVEDEGRDMVDTGGMSFSDLKRRWENGKDMRDNMCKWVVKIAIGLPKFFLSLIQQILLYTFDVKGLNKAFTAYETKKGDEANAGEKFVLALIHAFKLPFREMARMCGYQVSGQSEVERRRFRAAMKFDNAGDLDAYGSDALKDAKSTLNKPFDPTTPFDPEALQNRLKELDEARKKGKASRAAVRKLLKEQGVRDKFSEAVQSQGADAVRKVTDAVKEYQEALEKYNKDRNDTNKQAAEDAYKKLKTAMDANEDALKAIDQVDEALKENKCDEEAIEKIMQSYAFQELMALGILTTNIFLAIQHFERLTLAAAQNTGCFMYAYDKQKYPDITLSPTALPLPANPDSIQKIPWLTCSDRAYNWHKSEWHNRTGVPGPLGSVGNAHSTQYCDKCLDKKIFANLIDSTEASTKGSYNTNPAGFFVGLDHKNQKCQNYVQPGMVSAPSSLSGFCAAPTKSGGTCRNLTRMQEYGYMLWDCNTSYKKAPSFSIMTNFNDNKGVCQTGKCQFNVGLIDQTAPKFDSTFTQGAGCYNPGKNPVEYVGDTKEKFTMDWCGFDDQLSGKNLPECTPSGQFKNTKCNAPSYLWNYEKIKNKDPTWCYPYMPPSKVAPSSASYDITFSPTTGGASPTSTSINALCLGNMGAQFLNPISSQSTLAPTVGSWSTAMTNAPAVWSNDAMPDFLSDTFGPQGSGLIGMKVNNTYGTYSSDQNAQAVGPCVQWGNLPLRFPDSKDADQGGPAYCEAALGGPQSFCTSVQGDDSGYSQWCGLQQDPQTKLYSFPSYVPDGYALVGQTVVPDLSFAHVLGAGICQVASLDGLLGSGVCGALSNVWGFFKTIWHWVIKILEIIACVIAAFWLFKLLSWFYENFGETGESSHDDGGEGESTKIYLETGGTAHQTSG